MKSFSKLIAMKETVNQQKGSFYIWKETIKKGGYVFKLGKLLNCKRFWLKRQLVEFLALILSNVFSFHVVNIIILYCVYEGETQAICNLQPG